MLGLYLVAIPHCTPAGEADFAEVREKIVSETDCTPTVAGRLATPYFRMNPAPVNKFIRETT